MKTTSALIFVNIFYPQHQQHVIKFKNEEKEKSKIKTTVYNIILH